jgi:hypothetical protein
MDGKDEDKVTEGTAQMEAPPSTTVPPAVPVPRKKLNGTAIALIIVSIVALFFLFTTLVLGAVVFVQGIRLHQSYRYGYDRYDTHGGYDGCDCCDCPLRDQGDYGQPLLRDSEDTTTVPRQLPQLPPGPAQSAPVPVPGQ